MKKITYKLQLCILFCYLLISTLSYSQTVINSENFESGFGIWTGGGDDCNRNNGSSLNGSWTVDLRDNSGTASAMTTGNLNLAAYGTVTVTFDFRTGNFIDNEDFWLRFSNNGGTNWTTVRAFVRPADFNNSINYTNVIVTLDDVTYAFSNNSQFRFQCDASTDADIVNIDNVVITGYPPVPEIDVQGNGYSIADGDTTPYILDNTEFGIVNVGTLITRPFTIHNMGLADLNISGISLSNTTDFSITGTSYSTPIAPSGSTTFNVTFNSITLGTKTTIVTIANDDTDEASYEFTIDARAEQNFYDSDGDGVFDNIDIDDDNDGIPDEDEETNCKNSSATSIVNYKFLNETFGTGNRTTINTTYNAITTYCYEDGSAGTNTTECPTLNSQDLNDGEYTVYYKAANADGINQTPNEEVASWADQFWYIGEDHTTGDTNGRMAMFNASYEPGIFYTATITGALPNVPITYSFWVINLDRTDAPDVANRLRPNILVEFRDANNNVMASITTGDIPPTDVGNPNGDWYNFSADLTFNVSEFYVYFINNEVGGLGNDLAIDDIVISQTLCDTDNDGVADVFDLDSDNDGIPDVVEAGLGQLSDGRATLDSVWLDANGNGILDSAEGHILLDTDGDGVPNYTDLDSDNDAVFDVDESGAGNLADANFQNGDGDINGDGVGDGPDSDEVREMDFNSDGIPEYFTDGILDVYDYYNGVTFTDAYGNINQGIGHTYFVLDTDGDGIPDYMDVDSDNDGTYDIAHTLYANLDANSDGIIDDTVDTDGDGLFDLFDTDSSVFGSPRDLDRKLHLYFDGRNDYAEDIDVITGWSEASLMAWIKIDSAASGNQFIFGESEFYLRLNADKSVSAIANGNTLTNGTPLIVDQWIHLTTTYSVANDNFKLFVNGEEIANTTTFGALTNNGTLLSIGKQPGSSTNYYRGYIDEVRLFNKGLSNDELQKMVYQEIENNAGNTRGLVISRDITDYIDTANIIPLSWTALERYFRMDVYKDDVIDNLTTPTVDAGAGARIYNIKTIDYQTAPLPFVTQQSGSLPVAVAVPADGINGDDVITYDWSIVRVEHDNVSFDADQKHLGLFVNEMDAGSNPIEFSIENDSELNVSWYLKLDGFIDLDDESQLVQGDDSVLDISSIGKIERDQQGTADRYTYNYWASPVGTQSSTENNTSYTIANVMKDGTNPANPLNITFVGGYNGTSGSPIGLANYWFWKFNNLPDDNYASWLQVGSTGTMYAGEGFTMKGPGTGVITDNQNYVFSGKPNNGDIELFINAGNDYLIGNPYPSAIDAVKFINDNAATIDGTLYFWEHWGGGSHILAEYQGGYATLTLSGGTPSPQYGVSDPDVGTGGTPIKLPGQFIPISQGFFVVGANDGDLIFKNEQRIFVKETSASSVFVRQSMDVTTTTEDIRMKFRFGFYSVNTFRRQLLLTIDENATIDADWGYDGKCIDPQIDDVYWMIDNEKYTIQGRNSIDATSTVPLGLHTDDNGINTIRIDALENVPDDLAIYLHDKVLNTYHDLRQGDYQTYLNAGEYLDRFEITFNNGETLDENDNNIKTLQVYYANDSENLVVLNPNLEIIKTIEVFNILGQSVKVLDNISNMNVSEFKIKNLSTGSYIVNLQTVSGSVSKQVLVK